ncbi:MAG: Smr/MutS family protein [Clostridia bacterium]|nr:Smr/MutS family protein [Clostridia bacterium]MDD4386868.1 Smr/MutS family protein [Clostridia bacterium]
MFKIGDYVRIKNTNLIGNILRISNNTYSISINCKSVTISKDLIEKEENSKLKPNIKSRVSYNINVDPDFKNEIMLRHKTREEAIYELDKFIDGAIINKITIIRIIHGKNGGILRDAVHEYLKNNKNIDSFKLAGYFEGQFGVTIANLK